HTKKPPPAPVTGKQKFLSFPHPEGFYAGLEPVSHSPRGSATPSSPATSDVNRVTSRYRIACATTSVRMFVLASSSESRQRSINSSTRCLAQRVVIPG